MAVSPLQAQNSDPVKRVLMSRHQPLTDSLVVRLEERVGGRAELCASFLEIQGAALVPASMKAANGYFLYCLEEEVVVEQESTELEEAIEGDSSETAKVAAPGAEGAEVAVETTWRANQEALATITSHFNDPAKLGLQRLYAVHVDKLKSSETRARIAELAAEAGQRDAKMIPYLRVMKQSRFPEVSAPAQAVID